ncbi:MAG: 30S ribosome-binding factor RbfA [Holophagaceae bacterium]|jgi:ribosome-binding factor A|nr:ribosome-binding factor A [Acidobacteriota bacterium]
MNRPERLEDQIQFLISNLIQREVRDPDLGFLTVTAVRLSPDKSQAKIYFTVLAMNGQSQEQQVATTLSILNKSKGFLRTRVAARLTIRRVPELYFIFDESINEGNKIESLFTEIEKERSERPSNEGE